LWRRWSASAVVVVVVVAVIIVTAASACHVLGEWGKIPASSLLCSRGAKRIGAPALTLAAACCANNDDCGGGGTNDVACIGSGGGKCVFKWCAVGVDDAAAVAC